MRARGLSWRCFWISSLLHLSVAVIRSLRLLHDCLHAPLGLDASFFGDFYSALFSFFTDKQVYKTLA